MKHYTANDTEFERMTISSEPDERTLRELCLVPFEAAVTEAGTWSVMAAYNRVYGTYCSENAMLLEGVLRGEWGFEGLVMSDWFGTHSTGRRERRARPRDARPAAVVRSRARGRARRRGRRGGRRREGPEGAHTR